MLVASACDSTPQRIPAPNPPERLNVLLIMAEDLGPRLGAYGDHVAVTPRIDQLAREGRRYTNAFSSAGVCAASRAGILFGIHQNVWGAGHMRAITSRVPEVPPYTAVPPSPWKGFPELLRAAGYYAVNANKTDYQLDEGLRGVVAGGPFTLWDEVSADDWRGRTPGQPFFAYMTLDATHESQVWPTFSFGSLPALVMAPLRIVNHMGWPLETDPASVRVPAYYPDTPTVRADLARHYNNIAKMDEEVGALLDALEADGLADRTVVIFTTDHGDGLPRAKRWLYDSGIRVPLIVRWPGVTPPGSVSDELVSLLDLAPTILAIAGQPVPAATQGRVFVGPAAQPPPQYVHAARDRMDESQDRVRAVRDERFKYIRHFRRESPFVQPGAFRDTMPMMREMKTLAEAGALDPVQALFFRSERPAEELFDTWTDPEEVVDLAGEPAAQATLVRMRAALDAWLASSPDLGALPETELRERFWPGGERPVTADVEITRTPAERHSYIRLTSATEGASLGMRLDDGPWLLYRAPFAVAPGTRVHAKAVRYGFTESDVTTLDVP